MTLEDRNDRNGRIVEMAAANIPHAEIAGLLGCSYYIVGKTLANWRRAEYRHALSQRRVPQGYIAAAREMARLP